MKKFKLTNRILNGFLLKKGVKTKFMHNCCNDRWGNKPISEKLVNDENVDTPFNYAFIWRDTPVSKGQGHEFWHDLEREYIKYHANYCKS